MQRIFFSFLTIRLSILTRNKCKQSLEINVNNAKNIFFIPHYQTFNLHSLEINVNNAKNIFFIPHYQTFNTH